MRFHVDPLALLVVSGCIFLVGSITALGLVGEGGSQESTAGRIEVVKDFIVWKGRATGRSDVPSSEPNAPLAIFKLNNTGGRPVQFLKITTSCGCSQPSVRPAVLQPGETGEVEVRGTPPATGDRFAMITLYTDSPLTPTVDLKFHIFSDRKPPFVLSVAGDLSFLAGFSADEAREVTVRTLETHAPSQEPIVTTDLDYLEMSLHNVVDQPHVNPSLVVRTYTYEVRFKSTPPRETFVGEVIVTNPWNQKRAGVVKVYGESAPAVRVIPPKLVLAIADVGGKKLRVLTREPTPALIVEQVCHQSRLITTQRRIGESGRFFEISVRAAPGGSAGGESCGVTIRLGGSSEDFAEVPIILVD